MERGVGANLGGKIKSSSSLNRLGGGNIFLSKTMVYDGLPGKKCTLFEKILLPT